jgi:hypothetical protein
VAVFYRTAPKPTKTHYEARRTNLNIVAFCTSILHLITKSAASTERASIHCNWLQQCALVHVWGRDSDHRLMNPWAVVAG